MTAAAGPVLILGGTAEARDLATRLHERGRSVTTALAGRVRRPALPPGAVRVGGFSTSELDGVAGLAGYLGEHRFAAVVDATHPFAATISANAAAAAARVGLPLLRLERPGWGDRPDAAGWRWVGSVADAVAAGGDAQRPLVTTGRQSLEAYLPWSDRAVTVRVVDPPELALPPIWTLIRSRGPYAYADELALMHTSGTDLLVTKDSGGDHTVAKLDAARALDVPVVVVRRPPGPPGVTQVATTAAALAWLD